MAKRSHELDSNNGKKKKRRKELILANVEGNSQVTDGHKNIIDERVATKISGHGNTSTASSKKIGMDQIIDDTGYMNGMASGAADRKVEKRSKKKIKDSVVQSDGQPVDEVVSTGKVKRKRAGKNEMPLASARPEVDSSSTEIVEKIQDTVKDDVVEASTKALTEKAQKALSYARMKSVDPSTWKFNKGLQNWLVKNFWSNELIPDEYLEVVIKYLAGCQGGTRTTLAQTCESLLSDNEGPQGATRTHISEDSDVNRARAQRLLEALGKSLN